MNKGNRFSIIIIIVVGILLYSSAGVSADLAVQWYDEWNGVTFFEEGDKVGWVDRETGFRQEAVFDSVDPLDETYFIISIQERYGIESRSGLVSVDPVWFAVYPSADFGHDNIVLLYSDSQEAAVDLRSGKTIRTVPTSERLRGFYGGYALLRKPGGQWDVIDTEGQVVRSFTADEATLSIDHYLLTCDEEGYSLTYIDGTPVNRVPLAYASEMNEGTAVIEAEAEDGLFRLGLLDQHGNITLLPPEITSPGDQVSNGRLCFENDGHYGFLDLEGRVVIEPVWDYALPFSDGFALVRTGRLYGFIDTDGQIMLPVEQDGAAPFSNGRAVIEKDGVPNIIDTHFDSLLDDGHPFDTVFAADLNNSLYIACLRGSGKTYYITERGSLICPYVPSENDVGDVDDD